MRLKKIRMAGFKSFVDPTTVQVPSSMVGVVGPNGCGKSNIIDAVRWVMGESSRHLRGDSMEDVIFNGSNSRKPVGQASIELVFDNTEGRAGGQYAQYNEISIRRQVSRDGQSKYFLNGTRCRRRDILDIFLGTGLGPRSYAIIEQGMISRLIESKPEELRVYLEEAAGISKYKERRRETETRIRHARENMDRLNDLREEVEKQLRHLQRQARTAERYKDLKGEERRLKAELLALRWRDLDAEASSREGTYKTEEQSLEREIARLRSLESGLEKLREDHIAAQDSFNEVQAEYYRIGSEISRTEQAVQHGREQRERHESALKANEAEREALEAELRRDADRREGLRSEIRQLEPELAQARAVEQASTEALARLEEEVTEGQRRWDELNQRITEPSQMAQAERARLEQLEQQLTQLRKREQRLREELAGLSSESLERELAEAEVLSGKAREESERHQEAIGSLVRQIENRREHNGKLTADLDATRQAQQRIRGRLASLEALQEAALGKRQRDVTRWLSSCGLGDAPRLAEEITVEAGWETAVETVLGQSLEAVCGEGMEAVVQALDSLEHGQLLFYDTGAPVPAGPVAGTGSLADRVSAAWTPPDTLRQVFTADSVAEALDMRRRLGPGQSVVTRDGLWLGPGWLRVARDPDEHAGVLARESEIRALATELETVDARAADLEQELTAGREALRGLESALHDAQMQANAANRSHTELQGRVNRLGGQLEHHRERERRLREELQELAEHQSQGIAAHEQASRRRNSALEQIDTLSREREQLSQERTRAAESLAQARIGLQGQRDRMHEIALRLESLRSALDSTSEGMRRIEAQLQRLAKQREDLQEALSSGETPMEALRETLEGLLEQQVKVEQSLTQARNHMQSMEADLRRHDRERLQCERDLEELRVRRDRYRMAWQEAHVRCETVREQMAESGAALEEVLQSLQEDAELALWEERVDKLAARIGRLGAINLAAIDEFREQSERKEYLDAQHADLTEALQTLEGAIQKIDRETRQRFRETYERVNVRLQETFPRLFGGGQAHLEMTGDDLLTTGIAILARPPGKRLSTIHLMSGGEKALTAVALVFAIFELNPAPFCMLDEVDAPLDEANVGRFSQLVKEMSERVQFIFITHNKTTMEYADQLIGVTMHEPGVSRLVAVDVDEAARMATG